MSDGSHHYQAAKSKTITTTGNIDDLDVDGAGMLIMNNASTAALRGIAAGYHGKLLGVISIGAGVVEFANEDAGSVAANRILTETGGSIGIVAGKGCLLLQYDGVSARWRQLAMAPAGNYWFPATQNASSNANVLDDYEEGTWTVTIGGSGGESGQVYSSQVAHYVKIGQFVLATFAVTLSTLGTITGQTQIEGLPFTSLNSSGYRAISPIFWISMTTAFVYVQANIVDNAATSQLFVATAATTNMAGVAMAQADMTNTTRFVGTLIYRANQ